MPKLYSSDDGVNMAGTHVNNRGWQYHKPDPSIQKLPKIASTPIDMLQGKWYDRLPHTHTHTHTRPPGTPA